MKKYIFVPFIVFLCGTSPANKAINLEKFSDEKLFSYMRSQHDQCDPGDMENITPQKEKKIDLACDRTDDALKEIERRGYHWGPDKQPDGSSSAEAEKCWLAPNEKSCDEGYL